MSSSSSFDDIFFNILTRKLLENRTQLWPSAPEDEASNQTRIARLVGLVDRTRVFVKVLKESFLVEEEDDENENNQETNPWIDFLPSSKTDKKVDQNKKASTRDGKDKTRKAAPPPSHQQQLLNFAMNNPFPIASKVVEEQTGVLASDLFKVVDTVVVNHDHDRHHRQENGTDNNKHHPSNSNSNKKSRKTDITDSSHTTTTAGRVAVPLSKLGKNIDLLRRVIRKEEERDDGDDFDDDHQKQIQKPIRILHINGIFQPQVKEKVSKKKNKGGNNNEDLLSDDDDHREKNKNKKNSKTATSKSSSSSKRNLFLDDEIQESLVPVPGARLSVDCGSAMFMTMTRGRNHHDEEETTTDDEEKELAADVVGEVDRGNVMMFFA